MSTIDKALEKAAVVVPALEPRKELIQYVQELSDAGFGQIIVVDDGSGSKFESIFTQVGRTNSTVVLSHASNQGKGAALKTAFSFIQETNLDIKSIVTADSDGQHGVTDVIRVAKESLFQTEQGGEQLVLGSRSFSGRNVPWKSRLGNRLTSLLVKILFGRYIKDTQTGLRAYPSSLLGHLIQIKGDRFEYEMQSLFSLMSKKIRITEIDIDTIYIDSSNSGTHFRPLIDSARIYFVIFGQFFGFASSSLLSSAIDIALFALIIDFVFGGSAAPQGVVISVVLARLFSSLINFGLNKNLVFSDKGQKRKTLLKYYSLALLVLASSAAGSAVMAQVLDGRVVWAKIVVDSFLFILSYLIQRRWVFRNAIGQPNQ